MFRYFKSEYGEREYNQKAGQPYPEHIQDQLYNFHTQLIAADPDKTERITELRRVKLHDGSEWLTYASVSEGKDSIYNRKHSFYRSNIGKYVELDVDVVRTANPDFSGIDMDFDINNKPTDASTNKPFKDTISIVGDRDAYSIKFSKENADKLHKLCRDKSSRPEEITSYIVERNGTIVLVTGGYEQFVSADFETLWNYGGILSDEERRRINSTRRQPQSQRQQIPMEVIA